MIRRGKGCHRAVFFARILNPGRARFLGKASRLTPFNAQSARHRPNAPIAYALKLAPQKCWPAGLLPRLFIAARDAVPHSRCGDAAGLCRRGYRRVQHAFPHNPPGMAASSRRVNLKTARVVSLHGCMTPPQRSRYRAGTRGPYRGAGHRYHPQLSASAPCPLRTALPSAQGGLRRRP